MRLTANLVVHNELDRYLVPCLQQLLGFCDDVAVWDDGSTDGTAEALDGIFAQEDRLRLRQDSERRFFQHEGRTRQKALEFALEGRPTHILAVDADELILEGQKLRNQLARGTVWSLCMREVWKVCKHGVEIRQDGGWCEHPVPIVWKLPRVMGGRWKIPEVKLASGRTPAPVSTIRPLYSDVAIYHFGWTNVAERRARYERYVEHDGGRFHASRHIKSIMWPDIDITATYEEVVIPQAWLDRATRDVEEYTYG